jgi:hypothetical protein
MVPSALRRLIWSALFSLVMRVSWVENELPVTLLYQSSTANCSLHAGAQAVAEVPKLPSG